MTIKINVYIGVEMTGSSLPSEIMLFECMRRWGS